MEERWSRTTAVMGQFLWLIILVPILGVSGYSFFVIARYLGAPPIVAIAMSTCFDGVALLAANYAIRYAEKGLNGSGPRMAVRAFVVMGAFIQTYHARITHQPNGAWVLWASLPVAAAVVYEIHLRWAKREALARANAEMPAFGARSWILFPFQTYGAERDVTHKHMVDTRDRFLRRTMIVSSIINESEPKAPSKPPISPRQPKAIAKRASDHRPVVHIRQWAKAQGYEVGDFARLPRHIHDAYAKAHANGSGSHVNGAQVM